ncbi:MAG: heavy-metal-associated domain-containing protein [Planctomycetaceae bacterium]|nr:heavy-metal-associated domain-containing protein [Planctomycetaceae bacterium]
MFAKFCLLTAGLVLLGAISVTIAAEPAAKSKDTVMAVGEMCGGCVTKITAKLKPMPDVGHIVCDIPKKTVTVTPAAGKSLSPKTLWEAMESIGKTPKSLTGPSGTFNSKPKA